jgi:hypothetical protein
MSVFRSADVEDLKNEDALALGVAVKPKEVAEEAQHLSEISGDDLTATDGTDDNHW